MSDQLFTVIVVVLVLLVRIMTLHQPPLVASNSYCTASAHEAALAPNQEQLEMFSKNRLKGQDMFNRQIGLEW